MNKKDYIEAMNEIKADSKLKNETIAKIKGKKKIGYKHILATASMLLMVFIGTISMSNIQKKENSIKQAVIEDEIKILPTVDNFENLYNMLKVSTNNRNYLFETAETDGVSSDMSTSAESKQYSETNNQIQGVDEADIIKTDGDYIYYIGNSKVVIINVKNPSKMTVEYKIEYNEDENFRTKQGSFSPLELFIEGDKLVVIGTKHIIKNEEYYSYEVFTVAKIYNTKNKSKTYLEREIEIEGNYLSSRMIGDNVYLMSNQYISLYGYADCKLEDLDEEEFKPTYKDTISSEESKCMAFDCIYYFPNSEDNSYLNIVAFSLNSNEEAKIQSYLGAGTNIYSSKENLYITKPEYKDNGNIIAAYFYGYDLDTNIYKFRLNGTDVTYEAMGTVPGTILNQFSMDEHNGYFRIATTDSENGNNETNTNNLYVLNEELEVVGKLENLAKGEKIYSVRFMKNRAYIVTFVQVDPLFVIDLSVPENPYVLGELKIPGYSTYLHPYDETHLIGIGEDTQVLNNETVTTNGMKMSLFDISDLNNPIELYNVKIGEKGTYSEALYNHKAFLFSKEKNIIAFPVFIMEENYRTSFRGAIIYGLDISKGFSERAKITHINNNYENVRRIIYIDDTLFTLSENIVKASDLNTMKEISVVKIGED